MAPPSLFQRIPFPQLTSQASRTVCLSCRWALNGSSKPTFSRPTFNIEQKRTATHAAAGIANGAKNRPGRRLGLKRGSGEYVTPNTIIFRQRGSKWHPGENCHMGRDHTICASQPGYVRYYRNPRQHPDRKFIGVVLDAEDKLPYPRGAPRRRRLGLLAVPMKDANVVEETIMGMEDEDSGMRITGGKAVGTDAGEEAMVHAAPMEARARWPWQTYINTITPSTSSSVTKDGKKLNVKMKKDYSYGLSNYEIGRAAEHADVPKVQQFRRSRFIAWRKASARIANNAQMRAARRRTGAAKAKKKAKGPGKPRTRA